MRETSLWFFDDGANAGAGILADGRPAEFWALGDLARGEAGVRVRTATGRTCSVVLMRRGSGDNGEDGEEEEEEEEGEETEFQMIDGKEREGILEWVRRHRGAFGITKIREEEDGDETLGAPRDAANTKAGGEDSDSDSNFEASEESDGGSPSPSSGSGSDAGTGEGEGEGESRSEGGGSGNDESGGGGGGDDDEDIMMELDDDDPKHHPLLRAGALPKMSRAAMDAAVELVVGDLVGHHPDTDALSAARSGLGRPASDESEGAAVAAGAGDDDEEDELEE